MKIVYSKKDGTIIVPLNQLQKVTTLFSNFPQSFKDDLEVIELNECPLDFENYKIINGKIVKLEEFEIEERFLYGRFLTEEERILESMKPSIEEVRDAEKTIELLTLLQEVL